MSSKQTITDLLALADIKIGGARPWDIQVHNEALYDRVMSGGSLALGEAYMDGWWDAPALDQFFDKVLSANLDRKVKKNMVVAMTYLRAKIFNPAKTKAFEVGMHHYDIGNDLYAAMLDKRLVYTCGYWDKAKTLDEAQEAKLDLVCRKIGLKKGDKVLDIGSGWGSFINFAADKYGAACIGLTVSKEQADLANARRATPQVETQLKDYHDVTDKYDHIVSLGMFEHVGAKNYREYMEVVHRSLKDDGLFLLHTIGGNKSVSHTEPWIEKYIFPNSMLPSAKQIMSATEGLFVIEDLHSFGQDYDTTLMHWFANFDAAWPSLKAKYGDRFYRMWKYYLLSCAGSFRARKNQLWQIVLSKKGVRGGYKSVR